MLHLSSRTPFSNRQIDSLRRLIPIAFYLGGRLHPKVKSEQRVYALFSIGKQD